MNKIFSFYFLFMASFVLNASDLANTSSANTSESFACGICYEEGDEITLFKTDCCGACICLEDYDGLEARALQDFVNSQDQNWLRQYRAENPHGQILEHAKCPFCRHYPLSASIVDTKPVNQLLECKICYTEVEKDDSVGLSCGHVFCSDCLKQIVLVALRDNDIQSVKCPDCKKSIEESDVRKIANGDRNLIEQFVRLKTLQFLASNSNLKNCPTVDCKFVFINEGHRSKITCPECNNAYCSSCLLNHSLRTSCEQAKLEQSSDAANDSWKKRFTKNCPNCNVSIERSYGCRFMACTNCQSFFCWDCLKKLSTNHEQHFCRPVQSTTMPNYRNTNRPNNQGRIDYRPHRRNRNVDECTIM